MTRATRSAHGDSVVLLTGATGFLGKVVLEELVRRASELGVARIRLLIRAPSAELAETRARNEIFRSAAFDAQPDGWEKRVEVLAGDLVLEHCGLSSKDRERVTADTTHVIHCAASIAFDLPLGEAAQANVTAALECLALAESCPRIMSMVSVSTAYVTAHRGGGTQQVEEVLASPTRDIEALWQEIRSIPVDAGSEHPFERALLKESGHPNTYTFTKFLAEQLLVRRRKRVPLTLLRPSIIVSSERFPESGWIDSPAAFAGLVMMLATGQLRAVAGDPSAQIDLVPCDAVSTRIIESAFAPPPENTTRVLHAVAGSHNSCTVDLCRERILAYFSRNPVFDGPSLQHVGRSGFVFALRDGLHHRIPVVLKVLWLSATGRREQARAMRRLGDRQREINQTFAYFTHHSFAFESSRPLAQDFDAARYLDTICAGVHRNLLQRRRSRRRGSGRKRSISEGNPRPDVGTTR